MFPVLLDRDVISIEKQNFRNLKVNDIISVKKEGQIFTHRIIYKHLSYVITRGDNNLTSDGKVYPSSILGIVEKVTRIVGKQKRVININDIYLFQSTLYFQEIVKTKNTFEKEKIAYVFLKGLPLHLFYEGHHAKRIYSDCDILINKKDLYKVIRILKRLEFNISDTSYSKLQKKLKSRDMEITFYKIINNIPVYLDIHLEAVFLLTQIGNLNSLYQNQLTIEFTKKLLVEHRSIRVLNQDFKILSPENLIVYLMLHLFHHNFTGTYRYDLLVKILKTEKINYDDLAELIEEFKINNFIYPVLLLLQKYYQFNMPLKFLNHIKPKKDVMNEIKKDLVGTNIFNEDYRVASGVKRFKILYALSPRSEIRKLFIFTNLEVIYFVLWYQFRKSLASLRNYLFFLKARYKFS